MLVPAKRDLWISPLNAAEPQAAPSSTEGGAGKAKAQQLEGKSQPAEAAPG